MIHCNAKEAALLGWNAALTSSTTEGGKSAELPEPFGTTTVNGKVAVRFFDERQMRAFGVQQREAGIKQERQEADECCRYQAQQIIDLRQRAEKAEAQLAAISSKEGAIVDDLAMLVRRLVHALHKSKPDSTLAKQAVDYLRRKGLQGSPLREHQPHSDASKEDTSGLPG